MKKLCDVLLITFSHNRKLMEQDYTISVLSQAFLGHMNNTHLLNRTSTFILKLHLSY